MNKFVIIRHIVIPWMNIVANYVVNHFVNYFVDDGRTRDSHVQLPPRRFDSWWVSSCSVNFVFHPRRTTPSIPCGRKFVLTSTMITDLRKIQATGCPIQNQYYWLIIWTACVNYNHKTYPKMKQMLARIIPKSRVPSPVMTRRRGTNAARKVTRPAYQRPVSSSLSHANNTISPLLIKSVYLWLLWSDDRCLLVLYPIRTGLEVGGTSRFKITTLVSSNRTISTSHTPHPDFPAV